MKIHISTKAGCRAGALIIVVMIFAWCAVYYLGSYLVLTQGEYTSVGRSEAWNTSMTLAEAGVEEALAAINKNIGIFGAVTNWSAGMASDGWTVSGNVYSMTRSMGTTLGGNDMGYYTVYITNILTGTNTGPAILSIGYANWSSSYTTFKADSPARKIFMQTRLDALMQGNLVSVTNTTFNGNGVTIDSFDSSDPVHSDWQTSWTFKGHYYGTYPANPMQLVTDTNNPSENHKRKDNALVATDGTLLTVQNANIAGSINTAPNGMATENSGGYVGDVNWVFAANGQSPGNATQSVQPGHARNDMNVMFPDVQLPQGVTWNLITETGNRKNVTMLTNSGTYYELQGNGGGGNNATVVNNPIYVKGTNIVLWLPYGLNYSGNGSNQIFLDLNSDLTIYVDGTFNTGGQSTINNASQYAPAFAILGLPDCTSISLGGNGAVTSYVYAPEAVLSVGGGGSTTYDSVGAFFVYLITYSGHMNFHYDEALLKTGPARGYIPVVWQEVP